MADLRSAQEEAGMMREMIERGIKQGHKYQSMQGKPLTTVLEVLEELKRSGRVTVFDPGEAAN